MASSDILLEGSLGTGWRHGSAAMLATTVAVLTQCQPHRQACGRWSRPRARLAHCAYLPLCDEPADVAWIVRYDQGFKTQCNGGAQLLWRVSLGEVVQ